MSVKKQVCPKFWGKPVFLYNVNISKPIFLLAKIFSAPNRKL